MMNGFSNGHQTFRIKDEPEDTYSELLYMEVEPDYRSPKTYANNRNANKTIGPKILNFSLNKDKLRSQSHIKQEPEFMFDESSGTFLHYYTEAEVATSHQLEIKTEVVSTPSQRFEIKFTEEVPQTKTRTSAHTAPLIKPVPTAKPILPVKIPTLKPTALKPLTVNPLTKTTVTKKPLSPTLLEQKPLALSPPPSIVHRKLYKCPHCSEQFVRSYQLKRHHYVAHTTGELNSSAPTTETTNQKHLSTTAKTNPHAVQLGVKNTKHLSRQDVQFAAQQVQPVVQMFKSPIFTNGSIPIRVLPKPSVQHKSTSQYVSTRSAAGAPLNNYNKDIYHVQGIPESSKQTVTNRDDSLTITPHPVEIGTYFNSNVSSQYVGSVQAKLSSNQTQASSSAAPRIVVRKEHPSTVKFNEATKHEWSQIIYEVSLDGSDICFKCAACEQTFKHLAELDEHLLCHNGQPFRYKCELCDDFVMSIAHLRNHVHSHTRSHLNIKCDRCERRFIDQPAEYRHECLQQNAAVCHLCRQTFLSHELLRSHQFVHTHVKPYKCMLCDEPFIHMSAMIKHQECKRLCAALNKTA